MKKKILNKTENRIYSIGIALILIVVMSNCTQRLQGWKDLYLYNCSSDVITIKTTLARYEKEILRFYKSSPSDSIPLEKRIKYYKWLFKTGRYKESGDSLLIVLKPEEGMRIIHLEWLISPTKFKERDLIVDNIKIITKSDTIIARNRKEILNLRFKRRCKDGIYFKIVKYGRHGTPVMYEKVRRKI